jgi:hypothetical protein
MDGNERHKQKRKLNLKILTLFKQKNNVNILFFHILVKKNTIFALSLNPLT